MTVIDALSSFREPGEMNSHTPQGLGLPLRAYGSGNPLERVVPFTETTTKRQYGRWPSVIPGQLSERKGPAGRPAPLKRVAAGLDCHA